MGQLWALCTGAGRDKSIYRTVNDPNKVEELLIKDTPYKLIYELGKGPSRNRATSLLFPSRPCCVPGPQPWPSSPPNPPPHTHHPLVPRRPPPTSLRRRLRRGVARARHEHAGAVCAQVRRDHRQEPQGDIRERGTYVRRGQLRTRPTSPPARAPDRTSPVHCGPSCSRASHRCSTHRALSPPSPQPCTTLHTPLEAPRIAARLPHTPHLMIDSPLHSTHIYPCTTLHASSHGSHLSTYPHLHTSTPMILIPSTSAHIPHIYPTSTPKVNIMEKLNHVNVVGLTSVKWDALLPRAGGEFNDGLPRYVIKYFSLYSVNVQCEVFAILTTGNSTTAYQG